MSGKVYDLDVNPMLHRRISFVKSAIRIGAAGFLLFGMFEATAIGFILAELLGVVEEIV